MKKIGFVLLLAFVFLLPFTAFATTNTIDRNTLDNLGVNKKWEVTDSNRDNVLKTKKVDASEKIYDFSDILSDSEEEQLLNRIKSFTEKYKTDMVIVTDNVNISDSLCEDYAADFYDYNDFGIDLEKYSGIVLFINMSTRYYNFYLFGNSQLYFDNNRKNQPISGMVSYLKSGNYYSAVIRFIEYCERYYDDGIPYDLEGYYVDDNGYLHLDPNFKRKRPPFSPPIGSILLTDILIVFITLLILIKKNKMIKHGLNTMEYVDKKSINFTKKNDTFVRSYVTSHTRSTSSGGGSHGGGGGYHSSSGSSGGGHSSGSGGHF